MKILIAPLDWGLGHTTRCLPLIAYLRSLGHQVIAAASGAAARLLADNFPGLAILPLEGYNIQYSKYKNAFVAKIIVQIPKILEAIRSEHRWLATQHEQHHFDLVIADNRYGLYHPAIRSVILTHQLQILSGKGSLADFILRKLHYPLLERFDTCWVVDEAGADNLSGKLAHPAVLPNRAQYIGLLSQFMDRPAGTVSTSGDKEILVLLSGPEPMRGQLEYILLQQAGSQHQYRFVFVAGNPLGRAPAALPEHITYNTHLPAAQLFDALERAALVVCRSGYSTLMDLAVLGKKALLIPTPGQTEQEYLAVHLNQSGYYLVKDQSAVQLDRDIPQALAAKEFLHAAGVRQMQDALDTLLDTIATKTLS